MMLVMKVLGCFSDAEAFALLIHDIPPPPRYLESSGADGRSVTLTAEIAKARRFASQRALVREWKHCRPLACHAVELVGAE